MGVGAMARSTVKAQRVGVMLARSGLPAARHGAVRCEAGRCGAVRDGAGWNRTVRWCGSQVELAAGQELQLPTDAGASLLLARRQNLRAPAETPCASRPCDPGRIGRSALPTQPARRVALCTPDSALTVEGSSSFVEGESVSRIARSRRWDRGRERLARSLAGAEGGGPGGRLGGGPGPAGAGGGRRPLRACGGRRAAAGGRRKRRRASGGVPRACQCARHRVGRARARREGAGVALRLYVVQLLPAAAPHHRPGNETVDRATTNLFRRA